MKALALTLTFSLFAAPCILAQDTAPVPVDQPSQSKILYDVMLALLAEPALQGDDVYIDPSVDTDSFITLKGAVPDQATRAFAEERISHVSGVRWVMNNLVIGRLVIVPGPAVAR